MKKKKKPILSWSKLTFHRVAAAYHVMGFLVGFFHFPSLLGALQLAPTGLLNSYPLCYQFWPTLFGFSVTVRKLNFTESAITLSTLYTLCPLFQREIQFNLIVGTDANAMRSKKFIQKIKAKSHTHQKKKNPSNNWSSNAFFFFMGMANGNPVLCQLIIQRNVDT